MIERIITQIEAQNEVNAMAKPLFKTCVKWLKPFIGKKVINLNGSLSKKVNDCKPEFQKEDKRFRWLLNVNRYSVYVELDLCKNYPGSYGCHYAKQSFYLAKVEDGILLEIDETIPDFKTDYSTIEIQEKHAELKELRQKVRELEFFIQPFSNY